MLFHSANLIAIKKVSWLLGSPDQEYYSAERKVHLGSRPLRAICTCPRAKVRTTADIDSSLVQHKCWPHGSCPHAVRALPLILVKMIIGTIEVRCRCVQAGQPG